MVATRRGAKKARESEAAPSNTLNAPPKRGGRKQAVVQEAADPAPAIAKPARSTATKRKAQSEPEAAEPPMAKKPTANVKVARAAKGATVAGPAPAAPTRATRARQVVAPTTVGAEPAVVAEPAEPAKPTTTRARKAPAKTATAPAANEPAVVDEHGAENAPKTASRARKAPTKKAPTKKAPTKKAPTAKQAEIAEIAVVEQVIQAEPVKPAPRARKVAALKAPKAPVVASRATRGRNVAAVPQHSPLKAPARKPSKKAPAPVTTTKPEPEPFEEPFAEYPGYPATPAHIKAPLTGRQAMRELPQYPNTPAHILAPISTKDALAALPGYPQTPAHIAAPISTQAALAEMPGYPKTPAHIQAPIVAQDASVEMVDTVSTPAPVEVPAEPTDIEGENVMNELPDYPNTPAHIIAPLTSQAAMKELPDYPKTPAHIKAPMATKDALNELPGYPKTPAHIQILASTLEHPEQVHASAATPAQTDACALTPGCVDKPSTSEPTTPTQLTSPVVDLAVPAFETPQMPANIVWGVTDQEAFEELPAGYPITPAHITAPVSTMQALAELPDYPKTPAHISAPLTPRRALAELPSYPTTPALAMEAAIQAEINASVKKQTPSPLHFPGLEDISFQFAETSEVTDVDMMDVDSNASTELTPKMHLAPLQLTATLPVPEPASPKKSALRSPQKIDMKTPKKAVTWDDPDESDMFLYDGPLRGMTFFVDVTRNGKDQNHLFSGLLEDLGAKVVKEWATSGLSHVLYKDGSRSTLENVVATKGAVKCVNVGWLLDSEANRKRMEETPYLIDLSSALPASPAPATTFKPFTPARTPSKYALPPSSECKSVPTTPTSSEFDRSINFDDKENQEHGIFFDCLDKMEVRSVPHKKSSFLFGRSPIKTPSKPNFLMNTPVKAQSVMKPFTTTKKRSRPESTFPGITMAPPKRFRLV